MLVCAPAIKQEKHAGCKIHGTMLINSSGNIRFACAVFDKMLLDANVVITPGSGFGSQGEGFFRVSAFNSRDNVLEVAQRIKNVKW